MNGFLVLLVHTLDDLPVRFCDTLEEAQAFGEQLDPEPTDAVCEGLGVFGGSSPICVSVIEFENGIPIRSEIVKDFSIAADWSAVRGQ